MGDRANIVVTSPHSPPVWLYTHWGGMNLPQVLQRALRLNRRWSHASYLARIIFCEMVRGDLDGSTGYGISSRMLDNNRDILVVQPSHHEVQLCVESRKNDRGYGETIFKWSFNNYCDINFGQDGFATLLSFAAAPLVTRNRSEIQRVSPRAKKKAVKKKSFKRMVHQDQPKMNSAVVQAQTLAWMMKEMRKAEMIEEIILLQDTHPSIRDKRRKTLFRARKFDLAQVLDQLRTKQPILEKPF